MAIWKLGDILQVRLIPLYVVAIVVLVGLLPLRAEIFQNDLLTLRKLVAKFAVQAIYNIYFHPLRKYPGPKSWAASNFPRISLRLQGTEVWERLEAHKKYGTVVRMAPDELSWVDERVWKDVYSHRQGHQEFLKADKLKPPNGHYGILLADKEDHSRFRRLLSHAFSEKGMREQQPHIITYVDTLMEDLKGIANEGSQDMVQWFNVCLPIFNCFAVT
jgi:cytochrome P450